MIDIIKPLISKFMPFAQKRMGFAKPPRLFLRSDVSNADDPLGKTAYYDPNEQKIVLYVTGRHPKDVMRSLSHELVHHTQNCRGDFDNVHEMGDGYAQNDAHLREMEREAYETGNLCFRDWEDSIKHTIYFEHLQKGVATIMSTKDWKNKEIQGLLSEAWGFKMNLDNLTEAKGGKEPETEEEKELGMKSVKAGRDKNPKISPADKGLEEGGCAPMGDETAMMVVDDQPDMYGDEPEMDAMGDSLESKLDMILTRLDSLLSMEKEEEEEEELEEIIDTSPDAEDRGRGKKEEEEDEQLDESSWHFGMTPEEEEEAMKNFYDRQEKEKERKAKGFADKDEKLPSGYEDDLKDPKKNPYLATEQKIREAVRKALKASIKKA